MVDKDNKGSMTVAEAGRKGGETVRNERGREFYETIGRKGGATVKAERGRAFYEEIGRKGGETVKAERGAKFYEEIGKKGGDRVKATRGRTPSSSRRPAWSRSCSSIAAARSACASRTLRWRGPSRAGSGIRW